MAMHNSRNRLGIAATIAALFAAAWNGVGKYVGGEPGAAWSTKNGGHGRGNQARIRRAAKRRKNIRARASKRS